MAAAEPPKHSTEEGSQLSAYIASYVGMSFYVFLGLLPKSYAVCISSLQSRNKSLSLKLLHTEDQIKQMKSRRKEDSKANAKVVEIFASHRNGWQQEEKRLLHQIDASAQEIVHLRTKVAEMERSEAELRFCVEKLQREVEERDEVIGFMSRKAEDAEAEKESEIRALGGFLGKDVDASREFVNAGSRIGKIRVSQGVDSVSEDCPVERSDRVGGAFDVAGASVEGMANLFGHPNDFGRDFVPSGSLAPWISDYGAQDVRYDSHDSVFHMKHFVARRESPWKVDGESTGVSLKLKVLEQELLNLEKIGNGELSKVPSLMRKQARRYQALTGKIDDMCRRMQVSDPCEVTLTSELRTQRQTEFLLETFRLQQRTMETGQKLTALHTETAKSYFGDNQMEAKVITRRSLQCIRSNFQEIQRNLEIWLARIMGDLEGILARDGASRVSEYYISKYPFMRSVNQAA